VLSGLSLKQEISKNLKRQTKIWLKLTELWNRCVRLIEILALESNETWMKKPRKKAAPFDEQKHLQASPV
jgi:hypothetical protein